MAKAKRSSRRPSRPSLEPRAAPRKPPRNGLRSALRVRLVAVALGLSGALVALALALFGWSFWRGPGSGKVLHFEVQPNESESSLVGRLADSQLTASPRLLRAYLQLLHGSGSLVVGKHVVRDDLSARELLRRLARAPGRSTARVTVPEGFNHVQISDRLEQLGVCDAEDFRRAVRDPAHARELGLPADSAEGYLFPATYELLADSTPSAVVGVLVQEARRHLATLQEQLAPSFAARQSEHGLTAHDVLTLASIIEKEAAKADEKPIIASVFLNRLSDPTFRPLRMLQSDPTAIYGCLVTEPPPTSCSPGRPTPAMLRDASNPYNTYRHPGLPPGPISSPGEQALRAVLAPAHTDYLYFVAQGGGRHRFSRTFSEHRGAIEQSP
ncbi:MAG TPA: endolytic transglycosylase MltG [Polyangiaceae bacterium]|nr:endolytic transglycosylase MltG [Polyangiaceae bacterium]